MNFYVSPEGKDSWSGRLSAPAKSKTDGPFATLERARDAIRELKTSGALPDSGIIVWIRGGIYICQTTFNLTDKDSGTPTAPVVYRAHKNEQAHFVGGKEITGFKPVADSAVLDRIDKKHRDKILQTDLKAQGISNFGKLTNRGFGRSIQPAGLELFFNDHPMRLARWPNGNWAKIAATPAGKDGGKFSYEDDRPKRWANSEDIWLHGYWTWNWADSYEKVNSIDIERREISTYEPHGVYGYSVDRRYYALNILEELDEPGEWYLDRKAGILYFWPPDPLEKGKTFVSILEEPMVSMQNVSYVTIRGLTFEYTRGCAFEIVGGRHNLIAGCTLRNIGTVAVDIRGGKGHGIVACDISETGEGGIILDGGDRKTLTPGGHFAINNHIAGFSRWVRTYRPAVLINGVSQRIAFNLIHDAPHSAIILGGNEHHIEFNEIHHVCMETSDAGAFYMGRDYTQRGNLVRYNYFHHLGDGDVQSIYLDDWTSGTIVFGNVCCRGGRGVLVGGGRDNTIKNNIFIDCKPAVHLDARGLGWAKYYFDGTDNTLFDRLKAVNHMQPPYSTRYPKLITLLDDDPPIPKDNKIVGNICSGGRWLDLRDGLDEKIVKVQANLLVAATGQSPLQINDNSSASQVGFKRIPMEKIGLRKDRYRTVL